MNNEFLKESKEKLEKEKLFLEEELGKIAKKDKNLKGDWDARFPKWDGDSGSSAMERAADQVEEYGNILSLEHNLENRLKETNESLEKIKKGNYGKCQNCSKDIKKERLEIYPAARLCLDCDKK